MNFFKKRTYLASVLSLVALGTGCEITVTTDLDGDGIEDSVDACPGVFGDGPDGCPINEFGTLDGMWMINGAAADATLCAEAGIANVRFNVNTADGTGDASWTMSCSNQRFDSREQADEPTIEFNVAYTFFWEALDASGTVIAMTDPLDLVLNNPPQHATVTTPDFLVAIDEFGTLDGMWMINGAAADATVCAEAGIANVRFNVNTADGIDDASWTMPCSNQRFDSREQADDPTIELNVAYTYFWEALDASGTVITMTDPLDLVLNNPPPQHATVTTPDFLVGNEMVVPLYWQETLGGGDYGTCAAAMLTNPGDNITIMLYVAGDTAPLASDVEVACVDSLSFHEDDFPSLAPGSYELDIAATRESDGLKWGTGPTSCGIEYDGGVQTTGGCNIAIIVE